MLQELFIKSLQPPRRKQGFEELFWIADSLGFLDNNETKALIQKLLINIIQSVSNKGFTNSQELSSSLNISLQRTNYHLRSLIDSGFLIRTKRQIILRQGNIKSAILEMKADVNRVFDRLLNIADDLDKKFNLWFNS